MKDVLYSLGVVIGQAFIFRSNDHYRGVAQLGRALGSGPRGRWFKSSHSDQPVVPAPKYRVSASEIRTSSHDDGVRIYFYSPQPAASCRSRSLREGGIDSCHLTRRRSLDIKGFARPIRVFVTDLRTLFFCSDPL